MKPTSFYRRSVLCADNHCQSMHTDKLDFSSDTNSSEYLTFSVFCVTYFVVNEKKKKLHTFPIHIKKLITQLAMARFFYILCSLPPLLIK